MKRRSFLAALGLAPAVAVVAGSAALNKTIMSPPSEPIDVPFRFEGGKLMFSDANIRFTRFSSWDGRLVITPGQITIAA